MKNIEVYFMWLLIYSLCGWAIESMFFSLKERRLVNRGILKGPYCLIYGIGALITISFSENMENIVVGVILGTITMCILKLIISVFTKKYGKDDKISVPAAIIWAFLSALIINIAHPVVASYTDGIHHALLRLIFVLFGVLLLVDIAASFYILRTIDKADNQ